jgi:hypothetical protein
MDVKRMVYVLAVVSMVGPLSLVEAEPSVLSRVETVGDHELGECIRVALENLPVPGDLANKYPSGADYVRLKAEFEAKRLEVIRAVTESYAQIRLFDSQIEQIDKRLRSSSLPDGLSHELVIAKAELDMKLTTELAKLRTCMGVVPRYALGQWPAEQLNTWVVLDVVDANQVCLCRYTKPFFDYYAGMYKNIEVPGVKSGEQVKAVLSDWMAKRDVLPMRIEVLRTTEGDRQGAGLFEALRQLARNAGAEMDMDIRLNGQVRDRSREWLCVVGGEIGTSFRNNQGLPGYHRLEGKKASIELDGWLREELRYRPGRFPMDWVIEYHEGSRELASKVARQIQDIAREKGEESLIKVTLEPTKGKWEIDLDLSDK